MKKILVLFVIMLLTGNFLFSQDEINTARQLYAQGKALAREGKFQEAIANFDKAADIFLKYHSYTNYAIIKYTETQLYLNLEDYGKILEALNAIKQNAPQVLEQNSDLTVNIFSNYGQYYYNQNRMDSAEYYFNKAIKISRQLHGNKSLQIAGLYSNLAIVYNSEGKFEKALRLFNRALKIQKKQLPDNDPQILKTLNNLSYALLNLGNYDEALKIQKKLLDLNLKTFGRYSEPYAANLLGLANVFVSKNQYALAEEYLLQLIDIYSKMYGNESIKLTRPYVMLGIVYNGMGNYDAALQYYSAALDIYQKYLPPTHPEILNTINNIGLVYRKMGNYEMALSYYKKILSLLKKQDPKSTKIPIILTNIAVIYYDQNNYDSASYYYFQSIDFAKKIYSIHNPNLIIPYLNLGQVYRSKKDYQTALKMFQYSMIANSKSFNSLNIKDFPSLDAYYNPIKLLESLLYKGGILLQLYEKDHNTEYLDIAYKAFILADSLIKEQRRILVNQKDKLELNKLASRIYENAILTCQNMAKAYPEKKDYFKDKSFYYAERNKAALLAEAINATRATKIAGIPDSLIYKEKILKERIAFLETKLATLEEYSKEPYYRERLFYYKNQYRDLINYFETHYPKYYEIKYSPNTVSINQLVNILKPGQALISYFYGYYNLFIFYITKDTVIITHRPLNKLDENIKLFYKSLQSNSQTAINNYIRTGYEIFEKISPGLISSNINQLIIIPDNLLNIVPFEALLTSDSIADKTNFSSYPYLIKLFSISYAYSSYLFYQLNTQQTETPGKIDFLGIAPGFLGNNTPIFMGERISPIPATITEVKNIAQLFADKGMLYKLMLDSLATETNFKRENLSNYKIIHIATHGFIYSSNPALSALIFSKEDQPDDGFLYANEIYNMSIPASLVTLSACQTGLGRISRGEGVLGISRAFMYAGARNLIISLWKVADDPTQKLMTNFYKHLLEKYSEITPQTKYSQALQQAKLDLINSGNLAQPYFWASFILIGE